MAHAYPWIFVDQSGLIEGELEGSPRQTTLFSMVGDCLACLSHFCFERD
jgi:hypothetical protein